MTLTDDRIAARSLYGFARQAWSHFETVPLSDGPHLEALCDAVELFARGELRRVVLNQPPGTLKTTLTSIFLPAWVWREQPEKDFLYVAYGEAPLNEATKSLLKLLQSPWYVERWGRVVADTAGVSSFSTLQGGGRLNTTPKGRGVGLHFDFAIVDDGIKPAEAAGGYAVTGTVLESTWNNLQSSTMTRGKDPRTYGIMIQGQRVHEDDPPGKALAEGGWTHIRIPLLYEAELPNPFDWRTTDGEVLNPERFPPEVVAELRKDDAIWETQFQQRPYVPGGSIIKAEWIDVVRAGDVPDGQAIQSWDLAFKGTDGSDYVAGQRWVAAYVAGEMHFYMTHRFAQRATFLETLDAIRERRRSWPAGEILIEAKANGAACENVLSREMPGVIRLVEPLGPKPQRLAATAPLWNATPRRVHLVDQEGLEEYKKTLLRFPRVRHDDEVDATSQALLYLSRSSTLHAAMAAVRGDR